MEAMGATGDPTLAQPSEAAWRSQAKLPREPLFWASAVAFVGVVVGLAGTFSLAASIHVLEAISLLGVPGYILAALSLLGVPALASLSLGRRSRALRIGTALLLVWLPVQLVVYFSFALFPSQWSRKDEISFFMVELTVTNFLGSAALFSLGLGAIFSGARRLGSVLLILGVPAGPLYFYAHNALTGMTGTTEFSQQFFVRKTLLFGSELGVAEACLFALLGAMLLRGARGQALAKAEENSKKALRLYEVGLGKNDPSVMEEVVSDEFRDPRRGVSGKAGMRRIVADLWASYPDLEVSVESQEAEGDVVRTRLVLSGTDRDSGVMWYPPTGRRVSFEAEFTDRFRGGELVEHTGWVDSEGLLRQLGHHRED